MARTISRGDVSPRPERTHVLAVAQHRDALAEAEDLGQLVRDVDEGHPLGVQPREDPEEVGGLRFREAGRGLVEDEDPAVEREGARDLQELPVGRAERAHLVFRTEGQVQLLQQLRSAGAHLPPPQAPEPVRLLAPREDVLGDGEVRKQHLLLVDHADALVEGAAGRRELEPPPLPEHLARIGARDPRQHLHERGLPRPVLAHEGVGLAALHGEADAPERAHRAERLRDSPELQPGGAIPAGVDIRTRTLRFRRAGFNSPRARLEGLRRAP